MRRRTPRGLRLVAGLAALVALGTLLMALPVSGSTRALTWNEAFFTAVSALTVTGLSVITPGEDLSLFGQVLLLILFQVGGVGFMVLAVVVFRLLGRRVSFQERLDLQDSLGVLNVGSVLRLTRSVLLGALLLQGSGTLLLWGLWAGTYGAGRALFLATWHSASAFCNAGFDLFSGSPDVHGGIPGDAGTLLTMAGLIACGSLGVPVLFDLTQWPRTRRLSLHSRLTLSTSGILVAVGTLGLLVSSGRPLLEAFFLSVASRSGGLAVEPLEQLDGGSILLLSALMFVGGSPASMGGGVKTSTLAVLALASLAFVRGRRQVVVGGRTLPPETLHKAATLFFLGLTSVGGLAWLLAVTQQARVEEAVFEAASAFSTCGFSIGLASRVDPLGQVLLAVTMFIGRLGLLTLVVFLSRRERENLLEYPEERIPLG